MWFPPCFVLLIAQAISSFVVPRQQISQLPRCVTSNCPLGESDTTGPLGTTSQALICRSASPFPCASGCSSDDRLTIEIWYRETCPDVVPVVPDPVASPPPLTPCVRDAMLAQTLEQGCFAQDARCFCPPAAVSLPSSDCGAAGADQARRWLESICNGSVNYAPVSPTITVTVPVEPTASSTAQVTIWPANAVNLGFSEAEIEQYRNEDLDPLRLFLMVLGLCLLASSIVLFGLEKVHTTREEAAIEARERPHHPDEDEGGQHGVGLGLDRPPEALVHDMRETERSRNNLPSGEMMFERREAERSRNDLPSRETVFERREAERSRSDLPPGEVGYERHGAMRPVRLRRGEASSDGQWVD